MGGGGRRHGRETTTLTLSTTVARGQAALFPPAPVHACVRARTRSRMGSAVIDHASTRTDDVCDRSIATIDRTVTHRPTKPASMSESSGLQQTRALFTPPAQSERGAKHRGKAREKQHWPGEVDPERGDREARHLARGRRRRERQPRVVAAAVVAAHEGADGVGRRLPAVRREECVVVGGGGGGGGAHRGGGGGGAPRQGGQPRAPADRWRERERERAGPRQEAGDRKERAEHGRAAPVRTMLSGESASVELCDARSHNEEDPEMQQQRATRPCEPRRLTRFVTAHRYKAARSRIIRRDRNHGKKGV